ncbi:MAG: acyltransferase family protein, partial [Treponema sp.]|nr:acyltransferase family protein [Treponema sp.]
MNRQTLPASRLEYIDLLKAFTIFCVLWGHVIQQFDNGLDWFHCTQNPVFAFIYSFHMPLFFMVSGFFFKSSLRLNLAEFLKKKGLQLLLPWFVWCIFIYIWDNRGGNLLRGGNLPRLLGDVFYNAGWYWFLREMFLSCLLAWLGYKIFKKGWLAAPVLICLVLVAPHFFFRWQRVYFPVFLFGILLKEKHEWLTKHLTAILCASLAIFVVCLFFWDAYFYDFAPDMFAAATWSMPVPQITLYLRRMLIGIAASLFFFTLCQKFYRPHRALLALSRTGTYTMEIYILQVFLLEHILTALVDFPAMNVWLYSLALAIPAAAVLMVLELGI